MSKFFIENPITQILREINFADPGSAKSAILTHSEALNFEFHEYFHFSKAEIYQIYKSKNPQQCGKVLKNAITLKKFREINSLVTSLVKTLI